MKPTKPASQMTPRELAAYIDQSVLKPEFTQEDIRRYIQEGVDYGCKTVCVNPASLDIAAQLTRGTDTGICVVCDFPFGLSTTQSKVMQAEEYCKQIMDTVSSAGAAVPDAGYALFYGNYTDAVATGQRYWVDEDPYYSLFGSTADNVGQTYSYTLTGGVPQYIVS